jgi:hypothetical protein
MTSRFDELLQRAGPPTWIIIYTGADQAWRFAIQHTRDIADGWLTAAPGSATPEVARAAAEALLQEICQRIYNSAPTITWEPADDKGMIRGQVTVVSGSPPA